MPFSEIVARIRPSVVGIGILADENDPLSTVIIGTGFLVSADGHIMTNHHVARAFIVEKDGKIGVRNALARAVLFVDATGQQIPGHGVAVGGFGAIPFPIVEVAAPSVAPDILTHYESAPDLAVCRINIQALDEKKIARPPHLTLGNSENVRAGDEVGTLGFPLGLTLTPHDGRLRQMTPIAQKGVIAAVLPFASARNPHAFQLDISINGGSSGSPLFRAETGEVVGVVFAAPIRPHDVILQTPQGPLPIASVPLPTGFGYAVPINRFRQEPPKVLHTRPVIHE